MRRHDNRPKYLWAFVGYCTVAGILTYVIIDPIIEQLALVSGVPFNARVTAIRSGVNLIVGFFVFRFFVWYFLVRPLGAGRPETKAELTEPAGPGDGSTGA